MHLAPALLAVALAGPAWGDPPPPPDAAAEAAAEAAREYERLARADQQAVKAARAALRAAPIDRVADRHVTTVGLYPRQFPGVGADALRAALLRVGDRRGAPKHAGLLGLTDPAKVDGVRVAFGLADPRDCAEAVGIARSLARGRTPFAEQSDAVRRFVFAHPAMFPDQAR